MKKMTEYQMLAHLTQLHETHQNKKAKEEKVVVVVKEDAASIQAEASAKAIDDTIVCGIIIDLTNTGVMDKTSEASNAAIADEVDHNALEPGPSSLQLQMCY